MDVKPEGKPIGGVGIKGFRLVCHNCGHKWPANTAVKPMGCCRKPRVRIHDMSQPCDYGCADDVIEVRLADGVEE